jgi:hypothetical protein
MKAKKPNRRFESDPLNISFAGSPVQSNQGDNHERAEVPPHNGSKDHS